MRYNLEAIKLNGKHTMWKNFIEVRFRNYKREKKVHHESGQKSNEQNLFSELIFFHNKFTTEMAKTKMHKKHCFLILENFLSLRCIF